MVSLLLATVTLNPAQLHAGRQALVDKWPEGWKESIGDPFHREVVRHNSDTGARADHVSSGS